MTERRVSEHKVEKEPRFVPTPREVAESRDIVEEIRRSGLSWEEIRKKGRSIGCKRITK